MNLDEKIINEIDALIITDSKFKKALKNGEVDAITELALYGQKTFKPEEVLSYIEADKIDDLKKEAINRQKALKVYFSIIGKNEKKRNL